MYLASALEKIEYYAQRNTLEHSTTSTAHMFIVNPLEGASVTLKNLFSTHPATEDRIAQLQMQARQMNLLN